MSLEEFREVFRGSPVKRARFNGLRRNVAIALGNSDEERFLPVLEELSRDEDTMVAEHARWALQRLRGELRRPPATCQRHSKRPDQKVEPVLGTHAELRFAGRNYTSAASTDSLTPR